jgi:5-formyltetrahydrofolate cyclo-ligase
MEASKEDHSLNITPPPALADKATMRKLARAYRDAVPGSAREAYSTQIAQRLLMLPAVRGASSLFIYVSTKFEISTRSLIDECAKGGKTVLVPMIRDRTTMSAVPFPGWQSMQPAGLGILSPPESPSYEGNVSVVIVPGLGFTASGNRVGYGGGYYDRWLAAAPRSISIALAFEAQLYDRLPVEQHDRRVHMIVTESRLINCLEE